MQRTTKGQWKNLLFGLVLILLGGVMIAAQALDNPDELSVDPTNPDIIRGEILVKLVPGADKALLHRRLVETKATVKKELKNGLHVIKLEDGDDPVFMADLFARDPFVKFAEPNYIARMNAKGGKGGGKGGKGGNDGGGTTTVNDPLYSQQWGLQYMGGAGTSSGKLVAVLDTGINASCSDFSGSNFVQGYDFANGDSNPSDDNGHGTMSASVIAATSNNNQGMASMASGAPLMAVKVLNRRGSGAYSGVIAGIEYAADNGADIINMSLSGPYSASLCDAVRYANQRGVTVVVASGNDGYSDAQYPSACSGAISVGAIDQNGNVAYWSNGGTRVDRLAPGVGITVMSKGCGNTTADGTSFAAPMVAGDYAN